MLNWLRQFFSNPRKPEPDAQPASGRDPEKLVKFVFSVDEGDELGCDDCFELLDHYAELLMTGGDPQEVLPKVEKHLEACPCCEAELRALIVIAEQATAVG
jgi:hypothetical protein